MAVRSTHTAFSHAGVGRKASSGHSLPMPTPLTVVYNVYVESNTPGDYATFWAFGPESFSGTNYFTSATLAGADMSTGMDGHDFSTSTTVPTGRWMRQAVVCWRDGTDTYQDFYWDLPDLTKVVHASGSGASGANPNYFASTSGTTFFRFLDVEWASNETLDGRMFGAKCWQAKLPGAACAQEAMSIYPVIPQYYRALWGCWPLRNLEELRDISGNGHHLYLSGDPLSLAGSNTSIINPYSDPFAEMTYAAPAAVSSTFPSRFALIGVGR